MLLNVAENGAYPGDVLTPELSWCGRIVKGSEAATLRQISQEIQENAGPPGAGERHLSEGEKALSGSLLCRSILDNQTCPRPLQ